MPPFPTQWWLASCTKNDLNGSDTSPRSVIPTMSHMAHSWNDTSWRSVRTVQIILGTTSQPPLGGEGRHCRSCLCRTLSGFKKIERVRGHIAGRADCSWECHTWRVNYISFLSPALF